MSTRLDWLVALPSSSWKVNVPSSSLSSESINISMTPVFLSKFILYFWNRRFSNKCCLNRHYVYVFLIFDVLNQGMPRFMPHFLVHCVVYLCFLTSPCEIMLSLKTYSTLPFADIFSACSQNRTLPFSNSSTASSDFKGITIGEERQLINTARAFDLMASGFWISVYELRHFTSRASY